MTLVYLIVLVRVPLLVGVESLEKTGILDPATLIVGVDVVSNFWNDPLLMFIVSIYVSFIFRQQYRHRRWASAG